MPLHWTQGSPLDVAMKIQALSREIPTIIYNVAQSEASRAHGEMVERAPWVDRTANARQNLFGEAEPLWDGAVIRLGGTMHYQIFLEKGTRFMEPREIIMPVMEETYSSARAEVAAALRDLFA